MKLVLNEPAMHEFLRKFTGHHVAFAALATLLPLVPMKAAAETEAEVRDGCIAVHAAYDVGSSTTKVTVARVDVCEGRIVEVLLDESEPVNYQEALSRSDDGTMSDAVRERGLAVLRELQAAANEHEPTEQFGVATAALREAVGGERFLATLRDRTGIDLRIISDEVEAGLGFDAAVANVGIDPRRAVVWDIGGGSMQLVALDENDAENHGTIANDDADGENGVMSRRLYHEGQTASVRFRDRIIRDLQGRDLADTQSPNPITPEVAERALALARELAGDLPEPLAQRLRDPEATIIGIGGVHYFSIRGQLDTGDEPYTRDQVAEKLEERIGQSDEEIGGSFADTEVSNLILVLGYMQAWDIDQIQPAQATMSDGLLLMQTAPGSRE